MRYIERTLEAVLLRAARQFPAVVLTGPRQSGKTTLLRRRLRDSHRYVSLDAPDTRAAAAEDPRGFLELHRPPVIFDEVQHAPALLSYLRARIDERRSQAGQYILSGSQNLAVAQSITETLAGRAAVLHLLPLTLREITGQPQALLPWERKQEPAKVTRSYAALWQTLLRGAYPAVVADPGLDAALWYGSYLQTYLERDVRSLRQIGDLTQFQLFLRALAARSAQLLNLSELARDLGVAVNTAKAWLSVLEATFQVFLLRPYFANLGKRLVKTPRVYFTDVGTLCYLVGLRAVEHAMSGPMAGAILETAVVGEIFRALLHRGEEPRLYFWRTSTGVEVDLVVDTGPALVPVEVKVSATPSLPMCRGIERFRADHAKRAARGYVIHPGDVTLPLGGQATALPFGHL
jgi:hypothetical protein